MNINMNTSAGLAQASNKNEVGKSEVGMAVLKKAIESESQGAKSLIASIPKPTQTSSSNLPPHLGRHINTTA